DRARLEDFAIPFPGRPRLVPERFPALVGLQPVERVAVLPHLDDAPGVRGPEHEALSSSRHFLLDGRRPDKDLAAPLDPLLSLRITIADRVVERPEPNGIDGRVESDLDIEQCFGDRGPGEALPRHRAWLLPGRDRNRVRMYSSALSWLSRSVLGPLRT